jgi:hypothetical protein
LTHDDLTLLSAAPVRVTLHVGQQLVYVYTASVPVPHVTTHLRTRAQLEQAVTSKSTSNPGGSYVVPKRIDIGCPTLTPATTGLLPALKQKTELLHFGYVTQWEIFCRAVYTPQALFYDNSSVPRQFFMYPRFTLLDYGLVWLLIRGCINQLCGHTLNETQRKAAVNSPLKSSRFSP